MDSGTPAAFSYSRALAPLLWVFVAIMTLELAVVHLLVAALWSHVAAAILSVISLLTLIWTIALIRSLDRLPVLVDGMGVTMRLGRVTSKYVPAANIAGLRTSWPGEALKQQGVLNLALINYPNLMLDLDPPLPGRRSPIIAIAHRLDDPAGFTAAVNGLLEARA